MASAEVRRLYRAMQRSARKFTNYNVRECVRVFRSPSRRALSRRGTLIARATRNPATLTRASFPVPPQVRPA